MKTIKRIPDPEQDAKHRSSKDHKRWCGGHVGREHHYEWVRIQQVPNAPAYYFYGVPSTELIEELEVCAVCGRQERRRVKCAMCGWILQGPRP